ncbi:MAG: radical SAM protein [Acidobacteriota bacterium]
MSRSAPQLKSSQIPLVGIARLAAQSLSLISKSAATYFGIETRSVLNRCSNPNLPFYWTINPYRGCEFGCKYCYARYTHEYMGMEDGQDFERKIYNKINAARILARELTAERLRNRPIAIGTATDPYQPAERKFGTTRSILEVIAFHRNIDVSITTKSPLVTRDLDLLRDLNGRCRLHVNMTVTTLDPGLARKLEPKAPVPELRLEAVRRLAEEGIQVGVNVMPVLPWITDSPCDLVELAKAAQRAGASYLSARPLFLTLASRKIFLPFLESEFPALLKRYRGVYDRSPYVPEEYGRRFKAVLKRVLAERGLRSTPDKHFTGYREDLEARQLELFARGWEQTTRPVLISAERPGIQEPFEGEASDR